MTVYGGEEACSAGLHHSGFSCVNHQPKILWLVISAREPRVYSGIHCAGLVRMCTYVTFVDLCFSYIVDITISTSVCILALTSKE